MTPKTLFNIILKIIGIFFIGDTIIALPQLITSLGYFISGDFDKGFALLPVALWTLCAVIIVPYYLIFRSNFLIEKLKLDKGIEEDTIQLNIHYSTVLSISIIVLGGLILKDEIPYFLKQFFAFFQIRVSSDGFVDSDPYYILLPGIKIILGYALLSNHSRIAGWIASKHQK